MTVDDVKKHFKQVVEATQYYRGQGILHRDPNPSNILIGKDGSTKISDFGIACKDNEVDDEIALSVGGKATDPELVTGKKYDARSEIKGLAASLGYALTGKYAVQANPFTNTVIALDTGENLLDGTGALNTKKLEGAYERYLASFPKNAKPLVKILRKAFSGEYADVQDFASDFNKTLRPNLVQRLKSSWKPILATGLVALTLATGIGYSAYRDHQEQLTKVSEAAKKYKVTTDWDGVRNEVENNLIELKDPSFYKKGDWTNSYPKTKLVKLNPGDSLEMSLQANEKPWASPEKYASSQPSYDGKIYFEGFEGKNFSLTPDSFNKAYQTEYGTGGFASISGVKVPRGIKPGVRNLIIELYAPEELKPTASARDAREHLKFTRAGDIINRKVIPVQIGEVKSRVAMNYIELGGVEERIGITEAGKDPIDSKLPRNLKYRVEIPEENYVREIASKEPFSNMDYMHPQLPNGTNTSPATLIFSVFDGTNEVYKSYIPAKREKIIENTFWWKVAKPDREFTKRVQQYHQKN